MARTIQLIGPPGESLSVRLVSSADVIAETITLTERTNALGVYDGPLTAAAGTYSATVLSSGDPIGAFESVAVAGTDPENVQIRDRVDTSEAAEILAAIAAISGGEGGAFTLAITVEDADETPLQNVTVQILDGSLVIDRGTTDESGEVSLTADAGTYTIVASKPGLYASYTATLVVTTHATVPTITLAAISISPSPEANQVTCWAYVYGATGQLASGVVCSLQVISPDPDDEGSIYYGSIREATSDSNGLVQWVGVPEKARIRYWGGEDDAATKRVKTLDLEAAKVVEGTYQLPSIVRV
jgi:hypothetical protein